MIFKEKTEKGWKWRLLDLDNETDFPKLDLAPEAHNPPFYYNNNDKRVYAWDENQQAWVDATRLDVVDVDPLVDSDGDHNYTNDEDAYNNLLIPCPTGTCPTPLGQGTGRRTVFNRTLTVQYLMNDGSETPDTNVNRIRVTCVVSWQEGKYAFSTKLKSDLTDYLGRENLN